MSDLIARDQKAVWHPFTPLKGDYPLQALESAEGVYLYTTDGKKVLDGISSWWVNTLGHSNPVLAKALNDQALKLEHVIFAGFTHEPAVRLSEELLKKLPESHSKVFFSDDGSTAVEVGIKMTIQYWRNLQKPDRNQIIAIDGAYHGDTFGAMAVGERGLFSEAFHQLLFPVEFLPYPDGTNDGEVLEMMEDLCSSGNVASFIYEPLVQGAAGMRMYSPELLSQLFDICKKYDVLTIADEVFTGFYRTGKFLASYYVDYSPDIICLSKALTAGMLPMSVTTASRRVAKVFESEVLEHTFFHGHSFTANPLGCAVALKSLELLDSPEIQDQLDMIYRHQAEFKERNEGRSGVKQIQSLGTILAIELDSGKTTYFNNIRVTIYNYFMDRGILLRPLGNVIYFLPPYVTTEEEINFVHRAIEEFLDEKF